MSGILSRVVLPLSLLGVLALFAGDAHWVQAQDTRSRANIYDVANVTDDDVLFVRGRPGPNETAVGSIPFRGRGIEYLGQETQVEQFTWRRVRYSVVGWVNSYYLTPSGVNNIFNVTNVASNDVLFVRGQPGPNEPEFGSIPFNGGGVQHLGQETQVGRFIWKKIRYEVTGWVNSYYLAPALPDALATGGEQTEPPVFGAADAPHTFVLWGSYTCPYTAMLLIDVLIPIVKDSNGTVNIEWHHLPLHKADPTLHVVGLADREKFWQFLYNIAVAASRDTSLQQNFGMAKILELARASGVSERAIKSAFDNQSYWNAVEQDQLAAQLLGIKSTPGLFYAGYFLTPDGLPVATAELDKSLRKMLNVPLKR